MEFGRRECLEATKKVAALVPASIYNLGKVVTSMNSVSGQYHHSAAVAALQNVLALAQSNKTVKVFCPPIHYK